MVSISGLLKPRAATESTGWAIPKFVLADCSAALLAMIVLAASGMPAPALFAPVIWLFAALVWHGRYGQSTPDLGGQARGFLTVSVVATAAIAVLEPLMPVSERGQIAISMLVATVPLALGLRLGAQAWHTWRDSQPGTPTLYVGAPGDVADFLSDQSLADRYRRVGACTVHDDIVGRAEKSGAEAVVLLGCDLVDGQLRDLSWNLRAIGAKVVVPLPQSISAGRLRIKNLSGESALEISPPSTSGRGGFFEWSERIGAALVLLLISPVLAVIAAAIRLDSKGPVFFRQSRTGLDGRRFRIFKFRTMVPDAEARKAQLLADNQYAEGTLFKMKDDPRVTRVGRVLRATSLDELPQIINIVRGEMSWIGPRPTSATLDSMPDDYRRRVLVKPGLTGLWQVSGRSNLSFQEAVDLDLFYVENRSASLDARILARTVGAVVKREGAY